MSIRCVEYATASNRNPDTVLCFVGRSPHELQMPMLEEWGRRVREEQAVVIDEIDVYV